MLLIAIDLLVVAILLSVVLFIVNKEIKASRKDKLYEALEQQREAAEQAELATKLNPEEINNNKTKVKETLDKLN